MLKTQASRIARACQWTCGLGLLASPWLAQAQTTVERNTPSLPVPVFTCADASPVLTPGALTNPGSVLNTKAVSATDRGNQPRWAYAYDPANLGAHPSPAATLGQTELVPYTYFVTGSTSDAPSDLSSLAGMRWQYFTGREIYAYNSGTLTNPQLGTAQSLQRIGFYRNNPDSITGNRIRFFRYEFDLAPEVNPDDYVLTLLRGWADDRVAKIYMNDADAGVPATTGSNLPTSLSLGGSHTTPKWQTGRNTLTLAVWDSGPSATFLGLDSATSSNCAASMRTLGVDVSVSAPLITPAQTISFSGTASATVPGGTAQPLPVGTPITLTLTGPGGTTETLNTTVTGANGEYSVTRPAGLAEGSYSVQASLSNQPTVVSPASSFAVAAATHGISLAVSSSQITPAETISFSGTATRTQAGTTQPLPVGTPITLTLTGPGGTTETLNTTVTGANGEYSVTRPAGLAEGSYSVQASLSGVPGVVSPAGSFAVAAATQSLSLAVSSSQITPAETISFSGTATRTQAGTTQPLPVGTPITLTITGPGGTVETLNTTVTGANGEYSVTRPAGLAEGSYSVQASLSGVPSVVSAPANFTVRQTTPVPVPTMGGWALGLLAALLGALGMRQRQQRR